MKQLASGWSLAALLFLWPATLQAQQTAPVFKVETNEVLVPVVVRDARGEAIGTLAKEDFELFVDGKSRPISSFGLEETSSPVAPDRSVGGGAKAQSMAMPAHFVTMMFDDVHIGGFDDLVYSRKAVLKYLDTLEPATRVAFFTVSGLTNVDFTSDRAKITSALMKLGTGPSGFYGMDEEHKAWLIIVECDKVVSRMALLPGKRNFVFISAGFQIHTAKWSLVPETMRMVDHAIRSRVVINSMDSLGLPPEVYLSPSHRFWEFQLDVTDGTGGRFIRDTNDLDGAIRQLAATPKYTYVLGFTPDIAPTRDGFHKLEVKLRNGRGLDVQARSRYYDGAAPDGKSAERVTAAKSAPPQFSASESEALAKALDIRPPAAVTEVPKATAATPAAEAPNTPPKDDEITTTEHPVTFKAQANLVEVPVIVRDSSGRAVGDLKQEDFRIFDKGKRQEIAKFAVVNTPGATATAVQVKTAPPATPAAPSAQPAAVAVPPTRFVAFVFDDLHMLIADLPQVRNAVLKYLGTSVRPGDRVAFFTTSGRQSVDFTNDAGALTGPINQIMPSPIGEKSLSGCGATVSYFQAVQIDREVSLHPMAGDVGKCLALRVAVQEYGNFDSAVMAIRDAFTSGLEESRATLATLGAVVRRMTSLAGQRSLVLVSPGFFVSADLRHESDELMSQAIHSKVLISAIDARGVWTNPGFDACRNSASPDLVRFRDLEGMANGDQLIALAEDTGGTLNVTNDFFTGIEKAAAAPDYFYILGFVPQNLKLDGSFHSLKVTVGGEKLSLQARRGYWAPKHAEDEASVSKREIEDAVFSRDVIRNLPADMHTEVVKTGEQSRLNVLTSVDLKSLQLRKADDRNRNDVTIVATVFDTNGNFLVGTEKILQLRLRDETVAQLDQKAPVVITTGFDLKPGGYLVRLVVRDVEARQISAENAAVDVR
jgi:VWFA-related protein